MKRILICGLPDSGKTWISSRLSAALKIPHNNADQIRKKLDDWDFSYEGRLRQAKRMSQLNGVLDFVCPLQEFRDLVKPDYIIWMDKKNSRYEDTNKIFEPLNKYDIRITKWITESLLYKCLEDINHGMMDIPNFSKELTEKLARLQ